ncbi:MAG: hypothetical protein IT538_08785 [Variibacter sp.]|nr:hypothetical protein [Variibacter sp.]
MRNALALGLTGLTLALATPVAASATQASDPSSAKIGIDHKAGSVGDMSNCRCTYRVRYYRYRVRYHYPRYRWYRTYRVRYYVYRW